MKSCGADSGLGEWPRVFIRAPYTYPTPTTSPAHRTMAECVLLRERLQHWHVGQKRWQDKSSSVLFLHLPPQSSEAR